MPRSEQSGGEGEPMRQVLLEEKIRLGRNTSWSEKGGGFPKISKLGSYTVLHFSIYTRVAMIESNSEGKTS